MLFEAPGCQVPAGWSSHPAGAHTLLALAAVWPQEHLTHRRRYPGPAAGARGCQHICQHICSHGQSRGGKYTRSLAGQRGTVRWAACPSLAPLLQPRASPDPGQLCNGFCRGSLERGAKALGSGLGLMRVVKRGGRNRPPAMPGIVTRGFPLPSSQLEPCVGEETWAGSWPGLWEQTCGLEKKGFESLESFCGVGNNSAEVSLLPCSLTAGLATALASSGSKPRHVPSHSKQHRLSSSEETLPWVGSHK